MTETALLLAGFSLGAAALFTLSGAFSAARQAQWLAKLAGLALLLSLAGLQWAHFQYLRQLPQVVHAPLYIALLYSAAPAFYFFSRRILTLDVGYRAYHLGHFLPIVIAPGLPYAIAAPAAFVLGSGYALWLGIKVYRLRAQRRRFKQELVFLALLAGLGLAVVLLGFLWPVVGEAAFIAGYTILLGLLFFIATAMLLRFPAFPAEVAEAVRTTYAESTLSHVDCAAKLAELSRLMQEEHLYALEDLHLTSLADRLQLNPHQLSELINTRLGKGFSRYIRECRVVAAKRQLLEEPRASVLSIGLSVGFVSQSSFYAAFKEIEGVAPGQFRKNIAPAED
ncbi:MAG: helix-turn-helix domain-containing protein [Gammaproteobacteria bacterium]